MTEPIYDESTIKSLDWKEHIRTRPGMYIGKLGDGASHDDGKRKRCAEVLIYPKIHPDYIKNIYCFSIDTENYLANCGKIIKLHKDLF